MDGWVKRCFVPHRSVLCRIAQYRIVCCVLYHIAAPNMEVAVWPRLILMKRYLHTTGWFDGWMDEAVLYRTVWCVWYCILMAFFGGRLAVWPRSIRLQRYPHTTGWFDR